ncbi:MAG TPA: PQQ-binding-like beta-propeller repeat protein [Acidobacteriaceae bacterium]|nr:PQQ-binding-like beta-propeller repeat protein [Acidobacteriaceae bacterium]
MNTKHPFLMLTAVATLTLSGLAMMSAQSGGQQPQPAQPPATTQQPGTPTGSPTARGAAGPAGTTEGAGSTIFGNYCENCHGKIETAISPALMKKMTPEHIYEVLTKGPMVPMAKDLTDDQKRDIAEWVGGRKLGAGDVGDASKMPNQCSTSSEVKDLTTLPSWNGWSPDLETARYQPAKAAGVDPAKISNLHLKWAFGLPGADSVYGQPTIVDGKVYVTSDSGFVYSLDAATGCVHWSYAAGVGIRSAITIGPIKPGSKQYAAFFGDVRGNVYAIDAATGTLIWKMQIDEHQLSRITAGTRLYNGKLYVAVASLEEPESSSYNYLCCTFRGMVAALDSATGKQIWKTYTLPDPPSKRTTPTGVSYMGPAGVGVWGPVTIDPKKNALYFGTGNTFSAPDVGRSDAVMAVDLDSGKILWVKQDEPDDVWHTGCPQGPGPEGFPPKPVRPGGGRRAGYTPPKPPDTYYCPDPEGPDWDISSGVMLANLPGGKRLLVVGQKSGLVWGHDPDKQGELVWRSRADIPRGQITFGGAMDKDSAYFAFRNGGVAAMSLKDGKDRWYTPVESPEAMGTHKGFSAAISASPGLVYAGGLDGMFRIFSTKDGKEIWKFDTTQDFKTVNGVKAHGGSIGSAGPTVAGGMVFITSGYTGFQNGVPGNVLLAFTE